MESRRNGPQLSSRHDDDDDDDDTACRQTSLQRRQSLDVVVSYGPTAFLNFHNPDLLPTQCTLLLLLKVPCRR